MVLATNLGYPRIGPRRELKQALEAHWAGRIGEAELLERAAQRRREAWRLQRDLGIEHVPSNDFSLYDHVLDTIATVGAVPHRFGSLGEAGDLRTYFAMARGLPRGDGAEPDVPPLEMTKWFDTNYHYLVPELEPGLRFRLAWSKPLDELLEARALGIRTRPVLLGPLTFLLIGKAKTAGLDRLRLLPGLLDVYEDLLRRLHAGGADWVQIDEPALALDLDSDVRSAFGRAYARLARAAPELRILLATYFGTLGENLEAALELPVAALHLDLVRAPEQLEAALDGAPAGLALSLGLVDGRNVWRTDLSRALALAERAAERLSPDRLLVGPSCSLLHVPQDLNLEPDLDSELRSWLAFARQKLSEVALLARGVNEGRSAIEADLRVCAAALEGRRRSARTRDPSVRGRAAAVGPEMLRRQSPFGVRKKAQQALLRLPLLPTTTVGSLPQTSQIRGARARYRAGKSSAEEYERFLSAEISRGVELQQRLGLDVLVHGEPERNDMVEYFAEGLAGFAVTRNGWVQSYGSRCAKPPILYGDVSRPAPITIRWARYARSLTSRPVKGMLTGPVTILQWSFVRDDQPRSETCRAIALAIRDEVTDLERNGIRIVQIDEPALREGLPLRIARRSEYLRWAVEAFRLASCGVSDATQIHTHMCYGEFNDILDSIADLDADVISIESSRSQMELLEAFVRYRYPNDIGPGVYDIHSPRVPNVEEIDGLLRAALRVLAPEQLWVNPDCGLKTRGWAEIEPSLANMVEAARRRRAALLSASRPASRTGAPPGDPPS
jgi:5-methyltetrahydropteroyltriglutamate--homocysteine methyltransferase